MEGEREEGGGKLVYLSQCKSKHTQNLLLRVEGKEGGGEPLWKSKQREILYL